MRKYILMLAAAMGLAASCQKQEMVYFDPAKVVAPVLDSVSSVLIDTENIETGKASFEWTAADFGIDTQVYYSIEAFKEGSDTTVLASNLTGDKADISFSAMNEKLLFDLELAAGMPEEINFILGAKLNKGDKYFSSPLAATVTVVEVDKTYPGVYVLGEFNGWSHDKAQFLFDFAEEGKFYQGVIGLGKKAADGFKITGAASWDDASGNWGMSAEAAAESANITLANGSATNINCYSKSYYHFSFEKESLTLKVSKGFNSISAVLNGTAIPMLFNTISQKFYVDAEVTAGSTLVFRFDDGTELGGEINALKIGGSAITYSAAGNYRITLNMNNWNSVSAVFDKGAYGEGSENEDSGEEGTSAWGIVGDFNSWSNDIPMSEADGYHVAKGVKVKAGEKFKFRKDGKWASEGGDERTSAVNPVDADTEYAAVEGYDGIEVGEDGKYDIYLTTALDRFYVMTEGKTPADAEKAPEPELVEVTVYSDNAGLGYLYGWWSNEGGAHFTAAWPGTAATDTEEVEGVTYKKFVFKVTKSLFETTKVHFILNDGKSEGAVQTDDSDAINLAETMFITVTGNKVTVIGAPEAEPEPQPETIAVTFYCDNTAYSHIYGWWNIESSDNWFGSAWPGDASTGKETVEGIEYVKWVVNVNKELFEAQTTVQIILNDGKSEGALQTDDSGKITLTETVFLTVKDNKACIKGEEPETVAVTFYCDTDTYSHIYGWWNIESSDNWFGSAWPGDVTAGKETVEGVEYAKWIVNVNKELFEAQTTVQLMFSDGTDANKTEDSEKITLTEKVFLTVKNGKPALKGEESDEPETPQPETVWGIIGLGDDWENDRVMTLEGDYWVAQDVAIAADDLFKFRTVGKWHQDGGDERTFAGGTVIIDIEYTAEYLEGEYNIKVNAAGTYDVYLTAALDKFYIMTDGKTPAEAGKEDDLKTFKVTVYGKDCYDYIYGWSADTGVNIFGAWPGTKGTVMNETINGVTYTMKWEVNVTEEVYNEGGRFIMNNGSGAQTGDSCFLLFGDKVLLTQKSDSDGKYLVWDNRPADDATTEISVYCQTDKYSYLYGWWSDGTFISDTWPGNTSTTTETLNGKTYKKWTFTVSSSRLSYDKAQFILNNGNGGAGNQTENSAHIKVTAQTIITAPADKTE